MQTKIDRELNTHNSCPTIKVRNRTRVTAILRCPFFFVILALMCMIYWSFTASVKRITSDKLEYSMTEPKHSLTLPEYQTWNGWSNDKRIEWAQLVADSEAEYLGIDLLIVRCDDLEGKVAGCYSHKSKVITISSEYLASASYGDVIKVICHEAHHSYAHHLVDLYDETDDDRKNLLIFDKITTYKSEFGNYVHGTSDFYEYSSQTVEIDANEYADARSFEYILNTPLEWCVLRTRNQIKSE